MKTKIRYLMLFVIGIYSTTYNAANLIPCSIIYNFSQQSIAVIGDPNWDDQVLTYGKSSRLSEQKILRKPKILERLDNIVICNKYRFDFEIANQYMQGILIGNADNINNDAISFVLGTYSPNTSLKIIDYDNFSEKLMFLETSYHKRTNKILILSS